MGEDHGVLLLLIALVFMLFIDPAQHFGLEEDWGSIARTLSTLVPLIGSVFFLKGEISLLNSRAAQRFVELSRDPVGPLTARYEALIAEIDRPVAVFIDDLDRCDPDFVVDLLQSVQTLFRGARVFYVVAADRDWVCTSYEKVYGDFAEAVSEPGKSLGHLFLEKVFQLSVEVPGLGEGQRDLFWDSLINRGKLAAQTGPSSTTSADRGETTSAKIAASDGRTATDQTDGDNNAIEQAAAAHLATAEASDGAGRMGGTHDDAAAESQSDLNRQIEEEIDRQTTEEGLIDIVQKHSDNVHDARFVSAKVFERMQSAPLRRSQAHLLWRYRDMLDPNPRAMKRLLNAYGFRRGFEIWNYATRRAMESSTGEKREADTHIYDQDKIVRETILNMRWPILADYLDPHSTRSFDNDLINALIADQQVRQVVMKLGKERFKPIRITLKDA